MTLCHIAFPRSRQVSRLIQWLCSLSQNNSQRLLIFKYLPKKYPRKVASRFSSLLGERLKFQISNVTVMNVIMPI